MFPSPLAVRLIYINRNAQALEQDFILSHLEINCVA